MTKPFHLNAKTFGGEAPAGNELSVFSVTDAPEAKAGGAPAIMRRLEGQGANLIFFTFIPGQALRSHTSAHPITVQALSGELILDTQVGEETITTTLTPGTVAHLRDMVVHEVRAEENAPEHSVLLLTMLTGEDPTAG